MRVSKTRQHGSYRRVTELHLTQFISSRRAAKPRIKASQRPRQCSPLHFDCFVASKRALRIVARNYSFPSASSRTDSFHFFLPPFPFSFLPCLLVSNVTAENLVPFLHPFLSLDYPSSLLSILLHCVSLDLLEFVDVI